MRATSLRTERFVQKSLDLVLNKLAGFVSQYDQQCNLQSEHKIPSQEEPALPVLSWDNNYFSKAADLYINSKDWVGGQGRAKMQEIIKKLIEPKIKAWLNECIAIYKSFWQELFKHECIKLKVQAFSEVSGYHDGLATALADGYDVNYLEQVRVKLSGSPIYLTSKKNETKAQHKPAL
jgi:hypothetical protein